MPKKSAKMDSGDQDFVTELLETLESRGFVKQLRLECIADVKTKATYLQLKERMKDYVTTKMSEEWTSANSFREQVVECGVLALTVERVVEEVVSRKLKEDLRSLVVDLIHQHGSKYLKSKIHENGTKTKSSAAETLKAVRKICSDTKRDSKRVREQGIVAHSLASVSFPKLDDSDEDNASEENNELSDYESDASDQESNINRIIKAEPNDDDGEETPNTSVRARRERKLNPKYSLYHTSYPAISQPSADNNHRVETPMSNGSSLSLSSMKQTKKPVQQQDHYPAKRKMTCNADSDEEGEEQKSPPLKQYISSASKTPPPKPSLPPPKPSLPPPKPSLPPPKPTPISSVPKTPPLKQYMPIAFKSQPAKQNLPLATKSTAVPSSKPCPTTDDSNGNVRKSGRQRKINSIIFWDSLPPNGQNSQQAKPETEFEPINSNLISVSEDLESLRSEVQKKNVKFVHIPVANSQVPTSQHSTKRYNSSDLYKPRPLLVSSSRMKKIRA